MDKDTLYNQYVVKQKAVRDILNEYAITTGTLYHLLDKYQIPKRSKGKPTPYKEKEWLLNEYITKDKSSLQIAQECDVSQATITNYLREYEIPIKSKKTLYKEKEWLYNQRVNKKRSFESIAKQFGVDRKTIEYFAKKFNIPTVKVDTSNKALSVEILCHNCASPTKKTLRYLKRRIRQGEYLFFCSRKCANEDHAKKMEGEKNPNFEGEFHGDLDHPSYSRELRRERTLKQFAKMKLTGEFEKLLKKMQDGHKKFFSTPEGKALRVKNGIKAAQIMNQRGFKSSLEKGVGELLDYLGLNYEEQKEMYFWVVDFYLPEYDLVIEAHGDYWHANPKVYKGEKLNKDQESRRKRDGKLKALIKREKKHKFLVIWESDFHNNIEKVIQDINALTVAH
ncbi:hypothetical protein ABEP42_13820 [Priestia megaterium]|uniref:hypothetical protein n=1 Tax=Priestia megaterium TaxID=1404 RepID=UPI00316B89D0